MHDDNYGKIAYDAYKEHSDGKSLVSGDDLPVWENLPQSIQDAWNAAAQAAIDEYSREE